jgi:hypothetical protein
MAGAGLGTGLRLRMGVLSQCRGLSLDAGTKKVGLQKTLKSKRRGGGGDGGEVGLWNTRPVKGNEKGRKGQRGIISGPALLDAKTAHARSRQCCG